ncbi:MAG: hypothetical protein HKN18_03080 [Silicimonas sp.]|nr:hypothetical protein [Silicimonas sp.]
MSCLFASVTAAGILPWALGMGSVSWIFFLFSAFCPAIWIGVVLMCDLSRPVPTTYDSDQALPTEMPVATFTSSQRESKPLVLENPDWPGAPIPVFRHKEDEPTANTASPPRESPASDATSTLLAVARDMRKNRDSDARRPKMLPPPEMTQLPFLKRG